MLGHIYCLGEFLISFFVIVPVAGLIPGSDCLECAHDQREHG